MAFESKFDDSKSHYYLKTSLQVTIKLRASNFIKLIENET